MPLDNAKMTKSARHQMPKTGTNCYTPTLKTQATYLDAKGTSNMRQDA